MQWCNKQTEQTQRDVILKNKQINTEEKTGKAVKMFKSYCQLKFVNAQNHEVEVNFCVLKKTNL